MIRVVSLTLQAPNIIQQPSQVDGALSPRRDAVRYGLKYVYYMELTTRALFDLIETFTYVPTNRSKSRAQETPGTHYLANPYSLNKHIYNCYGVRLIYTRIFKMHIHVRCRYAYRDFTSCT